MSSLSGSLSLMNLNVQIQAEATHLWLFSQTWQSSSRATEDINNRLSRSHNGLKTDLSKFMCNIVFAKHFIQSWITSALLMYQNNINPMMKVLFGMRITMRCFSCIQLISVEIQREQLFIGNSGIWWGSLELKNALTYLQIWYKLT